jgi:hypothetical protein
MRRDIDRLKLTDISEGVFCLFHQGMKKVALSTGKIMPRLIVVTPHNVIILKILCLKSYN